MFFKVVAAGRALSNPWNSENKSSSPFVAVKLTNGVAWWFGTILFFAEEV